MNLDKIENWDKMKMEMLLTKSNSLEEYKENFKIILVKRHNWTVTEASAFTSQLLERCYEEKVVEWKAYSIIFKITDNSEQLVSNDVVNEN